MKPSFSCHKNVNQSNKKSSKFKNTRRLNELNIEIYRNSYVGVDGFKIIANIKLSQVVFV